MANADAAYGFKPVHADGSPTSGATMRCVFAAGDTVAAFIGDPVKLASTSIDGAPVVAQCAAGDPVFGVVVGFEANPTNLGLQYRAASTQRFCQVAMAEGGYFMIQDDGTLAITSAGLNANFIVAAGSTVTGMSGVEINSATEATTNSLDLQLFAPVNRPDNDPTIANADWIVRFNDPQQKHVRTGVA